MKIISLETGNLMLDGGAMFGVVPKSLWQKEYPGDSNNLCNLSMRSLLIDTGERKILIDCGMGDKLDDKIKKHYFLNGEDTLADSLRRESYKEEDITDVVFTHLHFDHCGAAVKYDNDKSFRLQFPNATHYVSREQWESAVNPNRREKSSFFKENFVPIMEANKLQLVENNFSLCDGITFRLYYGHTSGQIIVFIKTAGKTLVHVGDLIPTIAHIPLTWVCGYDINPLITMRETDDFLKEAVENNYTLFFEHDIMHECCDLQMTEKGIRARNKFSLKDFFK